MIYRRPRRHGRETGDAAAEKLFPPALRPGGSLLAH